MERKDYPFLEEAIWWDKLPNGLTVAVVPRPGFSQKQAYFVTDFGALHRQFVMDGETYTCPEGTAHFLEHKMFDMPGGRDVMAEFATLGASPNAFTSYDMTAYYFSCADHFAPCLKLLLEFVSTPWFTEESVEKEQGIIGQEIDMNLDNPGTRIFHNLMGAMYENHPIREEILGSRQTIERITPQTLYAVHKAFYRPSNMLLCVVGDVDPEEVSRIARQVLPEESLPRVEVCRRWQENMVCKRELVTDSMEVSMPNCQLGFKAEPLGKGEEAIVAEMVADLAAEVLFGESSELYLRLYEQGVIDNSFGGGFETIEGMAMLTVAGDSHQPEKMRQAILEQAEKIASQGVEEQTFQRLRRSAIGARLRGLDNFDSTCFRICAYYFSGYEYFDFPTLYEKIEPKHIQEFIRRVVTPQRCCLSVIYPQKKEVLP